MLTWLWQEFTNTQPIKPASPVRREPPRGKSRVAAKTRVYRPVEQRQDAARRRREDAAERAERRREELHELQVQRAAAALRVAQERANLLAERRAREMERARTRSEREAKREQQRNAENKADDLADLERKVLAGHASEGEIRYWFEKSGARVRKKGT